MKLNELLKLPVFDETVIVAGEQGLNCEVYTVNMMDAPDIMPYLKSNELLITTAFHLKDDLSSLLDLIRGMSAQGCAALGIKSKRYLGSIPPSAVQLANKLNLPLLELPPNTSLGDIVNKSLSHILDMRTTELHNAMQTHRQFTQQIMSGQGIPKLLDQLSTLLHLPVLLLGPYLQPISGQFTHSSTAAKLEALLSEGGQFLASSSICSAFTMRDGEKETLTLFPVYTHRQLHYLCIEGLIPFSESSVILTVEQATNVIAFELMKENALKQNRRRIKNDFFANFIGGAFSGSEEIASRGREFGLSGDQRYICAVAKVDGIDKTTSFVQYKAEQDRIAEHLEAELMNFRHPLHLFTHDRAYVLLMPLTEDWKTVEPTFMSLLERLQRKIATHYGSDLSLGFSSYAQPLAHVPISYKEANEALYFGGIAGKKRFIEMYQPKEVPEILRMIPFEHLRKFYTDTMQGFTDETLKDHQMLLQTLSVYMETHCQLAETAKRLYIHRNTVIYRLDKCEEIIGRSLKDPEETLRLRMAFRIKALLPEDALSKN
ncbi:PucR family transcriptional regulator [Saccharibacillus sp. JS10]|uniref:PucR family transcriptional regulator n=1 Tax=Saccharibacillus sp. JS10 TaxID=2950552 RepID=UPI00210EFDEF|nr:PucR family transcriptional regulator [Saccharibacillus sp. JS10]MCQ4085654.1 PucR family transcriptional regulator ligand-binding domain-containing protein [Saccharibacillus sp. JS10]